MQQVAFCLGIKQNLTPVYHPEANPVERRNRDLKTQLAILVKNQHRSWSKYLASIRFALNSSRCVSTGFTPSYLMFGRELKTIFDVTNDFRAVVQNENFIPEITPYLLKMNDVISVARETHEQEQDKRKERVDVKRRHIVFNVGDKVMVCLHTHSDAAKGFTSKFAPRRDGPYVIKEVKSPTSYLVADVDGRAIGSYHVSMLSPFTGDDSQEPVRPVGRRGNTQIPFLDEEIIERESSGTPDDAPLCTRSRRQIQKPIRFRTT